MKLKCLFLCFSFVFFVSACTPVKQNFQALKERPNAYLKSQCIAPLQVPSGIEHAPLTEDTPVPPGEAPNEKASLLPPSSLAEKVAQGAVSKKSLKRVARSNLQEHDHQWILTFTDEKDRIWKKLAKAFANRKIRVIEKNETTGIYYILDTYPTQGKITKETLIYQVHVQLSAEQNTEVYITNNRGTTPLPRVAERLLKEIEAGMHGSKVNSVPSLIKKFLTEQ